MLILTVEDRRRVRMVKDGKLLIPGLKRRVSAWRWRDLGCSSEMCSVGVRVLIEHKRRDHVVVL